jgi:hypothetical protein
MTHMPSMESGPEQHKAMTSNGEAGRRPGTIVAAAVLMIPVCVTWFVAGIAWVVVTSRMEGDGMIFFWILAVAILAVCLLLAFISAVGAMEVWRGTSTRMKIPAGFTVGLFFIALINLLVNGRITFSPTQLTPLVVGAVAGVAIFLTHTKSATAWFGADQGSRRKGHR